MSELTTGPGPAAPAQSGDAGAPASAPAPSSQPGISVSEAARLLSQQRKQGAAQGPQGTPPPAPAEPARKPSPNDVAAQAAAAAGEASAKPPPAPKAAPAEGLSALDRALGVPGTPGDAAAAPAPDATASIEIEGQRYSTAQLAEAVRRAADYTQKTQALGEERRQIQAQQQALAAVLPYIQPELAKLHEVVGAQAQKPDIALMQHDPQRYFTELHRYEQVRAEQERLGGLTRIQAEAAQRAMAQQVAAGNEQLAREFPFWADPKERAAAQAQIVEWATTKGGSSRDELGGLTDPRALKLMMKAAQFDRWVSGTRTSAPAQTTQAPVRGTAPPPPPTERVSVASEAFEAKPSIRSGAALLAARRASTTNGAGRR